MLCEVEWNENFTQVSLYKHISFNHIFQIRGCERRSEEWNAQRRHDFQRKAFAFPLSIYQICIFMQIIRYTFLFPCEKLSIFCAIGYICLLWASCCCYERNILFSIYDEARFTLTSYVHYIHLRDTSHALNILLQACEFYDRIYKQFHYQSESSINIKTFMPQTTSASNLLNNKSIICMFLQMNETYQQPGW